jgi:hypothetical protein
MPAATDGLPCWRVSGCVTLILVISCHAIVPGFGEREGEAREKLGASKVWAATSGTGGVCVDDSRRGFEHWEDATRQ